MNHICKITPNNIQSLKNNEIFVFGSNLAGVHGAGAAKLAYEKFGAIINLGIGLHGQSYALPTKDYKINTLPLNRIGFSVNVLKKVINEYPEKHFLITEIGCGLAGYKAENIAPLFVEFINLSNCSLPINFITHITQN